MKITVTVTGSSLVRRIHVFERYSNNVLGNFVLSTQTDITGNVTITLPSGRYFILKESESINENSEIKDWIYSTI